MLCNRSKDSSKNFTGKVDSREMKKPIDYDMLCVIIFLVVTVTMIIMERLA
tara:strand:+ start:377 stop:529 length:153 start_codon:yes stop_codon:yes gene_type:complete